MNSLKFNYAAFPESVYEYIVRLAEISMIHTNHKLSDIAKAGSVKVGNHILMPVEKVEKIRDNWLLDLKTPVEEQEQFKQFVIPFVSIIALNHPQPLEGIPLVNDALEDSELTDNDLHYNDNGEINCIGFMNFGLALVSGKSEREIIDSYYGISDEDDDDILN